MILKDKVIIPADDKYQQAGDAAERELAFYLKRYFADVPDVLILHDLRLVHQDEVAQIDHLVIHPAGITTIETKSVAGKIQMKEDSQWMRWYSNQSKGMASPLIQAKLQIDLLKKLLRHHLRKPELLDRIPFESIIAISTQGIFIPPKVNAPTNVYKSDLIGEHLLVCAAKSKVLPLNAMQKIAQFLIQCHTPKTAVLTKPIQTAAVPAIPVVVPLSGMTHLSYIGDRLKEAGFLKSLLGAEKYRKVYVTLCKKCASQDLEFRYGKFGYYLKCLTCDENTSIKLDCRLCGRQAKLRKEEQCLFVECTHCNLSEVVHRNDQPLPELA